MDVLVSGDWLNLVLRWAHLIVGIAWIGSSFYFVWQDNSLEPTADDPDRKRLHGEIWMVHGGGFYHARKYKVAPPDLPGHLHWFKWEAYSTWLTGAALLIVVYYVQAGVWLLPSGSALAPWQGVATAVGGLVAAWVVYDLLCRSPLARRPGMLALAVFALVAVLAWGFAQVFSGRAAYIHVGAALGTIMVANVFLVIIPNQRKLVAALTAGREPDPVWGARGKVRSVHNTYLTLPVLFTMISNHYPAAYTHAWNWAILLALGVIGAAVRHVFVLRHFGRARPWMLPATGVAFMALVLALDAGRPSSAVPTPTPTAAAAENAAAPTPVVLAIVEARCTACHAQVPAFQGFDAPPQGVVLETAADLRRWAPAVHQQTVASDAMPLGNVTHMTTEERVILGRWLTGTGVEASPGHAP